MLGTITGDVSAGGPISMPLLLRCGEVLPSLALLTSHSLNWLVWLFSFLIVRTASEVCGAINSLLFYELVAISDWQSSLSNLALSTSEQYMNLVLGFLVLDNHRWCFWSWDFRVLCLFPAEDEDTQICRWAFRYVLSLIKFLHVLVSKWKEVSMHWRMWYLDTV